MELADEHSERQLEHALIENIRNFLCEMGYSFAFLGNQFRLTVDDEDFFIDLLLFQLELQCLVAIELKIGDFKPEYKGKMEFYLNLLNDTVKLPKENDAIGIIICKNKKRTIVEYALKTSVHPIGVSTYSISPALPESYKNILPDGKTIAQKLQTFDLDRADEEVRTDENCEFMWLIRDNFKKGNHGFLFFSRNFNMGSVFLTLLLPQITINSGELLSCLDQRKYSGKTLH